MSAIAEPLAHAHIDDKLARRNAMVLSVAQALAGGNNTVIVSTGSIIGALLAPDKGLSTLPITAMVILPESVLAAAAFVAGWSFVPPLHAIKRLEPIVAITAAPRAIRFVIPISTGRRFMPRRVRPRLHG